MRENRSMPPGAVIPVLAYADVRQAVAWLSAAFGFQERLRIGDHRSQLVHGEGAVAVTGAPAGGPGPVSAHAIMVRVEDVDGHFQRARACGAAILSPPETFPFGERQYSALDPGGHHWTFSQTVEDVEPGAWGGELLLRP